MSEWKPIETAPKRVLMVAADHERDYYAVGCINTNGEFEETEKDGSPRGVGFYPTHWMELPPTPPSPKSEMK